MATTAITRSISSTSTINKYTLSMWIKRGVVSANYPRLFTSNGGSGDVYLRFNNDDTLEWSGDASNASSAGYAITNRRFRDTSAWYHIVIRFDSTQGSASARLRIYVNGTQEESFSTYTDINQNATDKIVDTSKVHRIGGNAGSADSFFDGSVTHFHFTQGYSYAPTEFGEVDSTSGIWKAKTSPSVTYGTNGFFLKMENSGAMGTDSSGNSNTFTVSGSLTKNQDTPANNFTTMNPLDNYFAGGTFSNGNNTIISRNTGYSYNTSTVGVNTGKFYWECKWSATPTGSGSQLGIGIAKRPTASTTDFLGSNLYSYAYFGGGAIFHNDSQVIAYNSYAIGDIIGIALDMDNNRLYFSKNGVFQNSSDPANGTNPISILAPDSVSGDSGVYFAGFGDGNNSLQQTAQFNFGNGYFGTTAVSSANADGNGVGKMEYAVPSGYYTLNTKNLKDFG